MPRNGSGTMTVPNQFVVGTVANPDRVNDNFNDVAAALTGSLPRDGQAGMTGAFKATDGTVMLPSIAFNADTDTGFYRVSDGVVGFVANGVRILTMNSQGITLDNPADPSATIKSHGTVTSGTESFNYNDAAIHSVTQNGNVTFAPANIPDGQDLQINLVHTSGTLTWSGVSRWVTGVGVPSETFAGTGIDPAAMGSNTTFQIVLSKFGAATVGYIARTL